MIRRQRCCGAASVGTLFDAEAREENGGHRNCFCFFTAQMKCSLCVCVCVCACLCAAVCSYHGFHLFTVVRPSVSRVRSASCLVLRPSVRLHHPPQHRSPLRVRVARKGKERFYLALYTTHNVHRCEGRTQLHKARANALNTQQRWRASGCVKMKQIAASSSSACQSFACGQCHYISLFWSTCSFSAALCDAVVWCPIVSLFLLLAMLSLFAAYCPRYLLPAPAHV